jgi:hypothetical protein
MDLESMTDGDLQVELGYGTYFGSWWWVGGGVSSWLVWLGWAGLGWLVHYSGKGLVGA